MNDPFKTFDEIRQAYLRYMDSPFSLRYPALMAERRVLFDQDRQLYREPLLEPVAPYQTSGMNVHEACSQLGVPSDSADFISTGLFPPDRRARPRLLYQHQLEAWDSSRRGEAVVVTTGTGSGKTECYLIPVFSYLIEESNRWLGAQAPSPDAWWRRRGAPRASQRAEEGDGRPAAVRALMLFPLNALIEDQLGRIREAADGPASRQWLRRHREGHRFWFGRYTGATPVPGPRTGDPDQVEKRRQKLRARLKRMDDQFGRARASVRTAGSDPKILNYFQDPEGSEMWSRWDMQEHPPDILITNYSMLNIMLMRSVEEDIFEKTRLWLADDAANLFHLVVDELHTYRGTPGTEVGYLLRVLLHRLGLHPDHPQLRLISTSASIERDDRSSDYLEQLFGRDRSSFTVVQGSLRAFPAQQQPIITHKSAFAQFHRDLQAFPARAARSLADGLGSPSGPNEGATLNSCLEQVQAVSQVLAAATDGGRLKPFTLQTAAERLFGASEAEELAAAKGLFLAMIRAREDDETAPLPLRVHYFFHNAGRIWACVNPDCCGRTAATPPGADPPPVGRLYMEPRPRCDSCRCRVLELLYCQPCGEVFVGGYKREDPDNPNSWHLSPDYPNLEHIPDRSASLERKYGEFLVFWPAHGKRLAHTTAARGPKWVWTEGEWAPSHLDYTDGKLTLRRTYSPSEGGSGFAYMANQDEANAFASKCPHCAADWMRRRRVRSPIRDLGSGFQRIVQLLCDSLIRQIEDRSRRKLVLFSDSRQDAAKLATGIKRDHHLDLVRQIAYHCLVAQAESSSLGYREQAELHANACALYVLETKRESDELDAAEKEERRRLLSLLPDDVKGSVFTYAAGSGPRPSILTPPAALSRFTSLPFNDLLTTVRVSLLKLGCNPGGPKPRLEVYKPRRQGKKRPKPIVWTSLIDWNRPDYRSDLQPLERDLRDDIERELTQSVVQGVLFASGSRDFESLRLGFLWNAGDGPGRPEEEAAASVVRILCSRFRWFGSDADGQTDPPAYVEDFLRRAADRNGVPRDGFRDSVCGMLQPLLNQWLVQVDRLQILSPRPGADGAIAVHGCSRCGTVHLHPSAGICTSCRAELTGSPVSYVSGRDPEDYYEFLARCPDTFRLYSMELTGQTNPVDRIDRQRKFQDVFMDNEHADACRIDLLSVTTTMEAGVDIGSLDAISLANMPPVRFNYQQRVGRAGRRGGGMSAALTLCRGRSHDDYYFERPLLITAEPPPRPYVDVRRPEIARRIINKEVLRRAFGGIQLPYSGDSVHGEFGCSGDWAPLHRVTVQAWITANPGTIRRIAQAVLKRTAMDNSQGVQEAFDWVSGGLLQAVDGAASACPPSSSLSERLASLGTLPMFGFPTRVRYLYHEDPYHSRFGGEWPPESGIIDRNLDIAISQFAPGSQTVKDDMLHTAVGIADFRPGGEAADPLAAVELIGLCLRCQALVRTNPADSCPYCGASDADDSYRTVSLNEPPGFMTWFQISEKAEYNGVFEFSPRALRARMGAEQRQPTPRRNFIADSLYQARVYRVNDNDGREFEFRKLATRHAWVYEAAYQQALLDLPQNERGTISGLSFDSAVAPLTRSLAAISTTDVLTIGISSVPVGLCLNPAIPEGRAAWYSFGFLLRRAAAVRLDVAEAELEVGIQPVTGDFNYPFAPPSARIFISDSLENGAGYSAHLGDVDVLESLLKSILAPGPTPETSFYAPLVGPDHESECSSSCHRCLREFGNMAYHPLLDWRLGLDMARLALDSSQPIDFTPSYWSSLLARSAVPYFEGLGLVRTAVFGGIPAGIDDRRGEAIILMHPLWDLSTANFHPAAAAAFVEAERAGLTPVSRSLFRAIRFPYE